MCTFYLTLINTLMLVHLGIIVAIAIIVWLSNNLYGFWLYRLPVKPIRYVNNNGIIVKSTCLPTRPHILFSLKKLVYQLEWPNARGHDFKLRHPSINI